MKRLIVVDVSSFIYRAFYAIRRLTSPAGVPVNAVYGVLSMLIKLISEKDPTHILIARDMKDKTFREEIYEDYKANRDEVPDELIPQFVLIDKLLELLKVPCFSLKGYEADDIIGSVVTQWKDSFDEIFIASSDKDLMQFVGDNIYQLDTKLEKVYGVDEVIEKMGVRPDQIVDYLSLVGDSSDNIPGVKGIGAKGASKLLAEYETLDEAVKNLDSIKNKKVKTSLENNLETAYLSRKLVEIVVDLELKHKAMDCKYKLEVKGDLLTFLKDLGFKSFVSKFEKLNQTMETPPVSEVPHDISSQYKFKVVKSEEELEKLFSKIENNQALALHTTYTSEDQFKREISSVTISFDGKSAFFLPFKNIGADIDNLPDYTLDATIKKLWLNSDLEIISYDLKKDLSYLFNLNKKVKATFFDLKQAHYVVDVSSQHELNFLSQKYLHQEIEQGFLPGAVEVVTIYQIAKILKKELEKLDLEKVFYEIDNPLVEVLSLMEFHGILLNTPYLKQLSGKFTKEINKIESEIEKIVGDKINLKSPKQVSDLLFNKLSLPVIKKTKTGFSTDSEVLSELELLEISEVPGLILKYRELEKLLSTYINVLPNLVDSYSGRIHTNFDQAVTATGRLSSKNPNLQNIPVRRDYGKRIRKGFIAAPGKLLLSADYSQMELRLLAHYSQDPTMVKAFREDQDIHVLTASEVQGVSPSKVTAKDRSLAKTVNFGLMYGQSSFGLSKLLKIDRAHAKEYIEKYFGRFSQVKILIDQLKEDCAQKGYSETLCGRKRFIPDIHAKNRMVKSMAERLAVNSPIQGTAADIIKIAMIAIAKKIDQQKLKSKLILQVHDELIFELPEEELDIMKKLVKTQMEKAMKLKVPLQVDINVGVNWYDLK